MTKNVCHDVATMEADGNITTIANRSVEEREMEHWIKRSAISIGLQFSDIGFDRKYSNALHQLLTELAVRN